MNPQKRIRPMLSMREALRMPQIILLPALLVSCALIPLTLISLDTSSILRNLLGATFATLVFGGLILFAIVIPAIHGNTLSRTGVDGTAKILKKEKRERILITSTHNMAMQDAWVIFEFTPEGAVTPLVLEAELSKGYGKLQEGKNAKIRYASSNPRIVRFEVEL